MLNNANAAVGNTVVFCAQFNGAASSIIINNTAAVTGSVGVANGSGFTLGSVANGGGNYSNIQTYEALIYNVAHDASTRANVIRALMSKHGVA